MKRKLSGTLVFDASVLIELVYSTKGGVKLQRAMLDGSIDVQTTGIAITELRYILCRRLGEEETNQRVKKLLASGYITVEDISELIESAARCKCYRAISLPDCFTLSLAKLLASPAVFAKREEDLIKEMEKTPFDEEVLFLQDYVNP